LQPTELGAPPRDYETAFRTLRAGDPQALLFLMSGTFFRDRGSSLRLRASIACPRSLGSLNGLKQVDCFPTDLISTRNIGERRLRRQGSERHESWRTPGRAAEQI
jgi:hypothetical protein